MIEETLTAKQQALDDNKSALTYAYLIDDIDTLKLVAEHLMEISVVS